MSNKFNKNREVSTSYSKIPMFYTGLKHNSNKNKELVLIDKIGDNYIACWRNNKLCKTGIEFLVKSSKNGFIYKDKEYKLGSMVF